MTNLTTLYLRNNQISDISSLAGLTSLTILYLNNNQISDISALTSNPGIGSGDTVDLSSNPLSCHAMLVDIPEPLSRDVIVFSDAQCNPLPSISLGGLALLGGLIFAIALGGLAVQRRRRAL